MKYIEAIKKSSISIANREDDNFIYYRSHHEYEKVCKKTHKHTKLSLRKGESIGLERILAEGAFNDWQPYEREEKCLN